VLHGKLRHILVGTFAAIGVIAGGGSIARIDAQGFAVPLDLAAPQPEHGATA